MTILQNLLAAYRHGAPFPTYAQLIGLVVGDADLNKLLYDYRHGALFPSYDQLVAIAYRDEAHG